jgi:predicted amidohydrolase
MRIAYIQFEPIFGHKKRNLGRIESLLRQVIKEAPNLIVLPELCSTGYVFRSKNELRRLAEEIPEGKTTKTLSNWGKDHGVHIVAGIAEKEGKKFYNSSILLGPEGFTDKYRKIHLFHNEKTWFSTGDIPLEVYEISKAKIGMMICFDWFFPEVPRVLALKGAQIICHPANLVLPYCQKALLGTAIQNKVFIITANRIGIERGVEFTGNSQIIDPEMKVISYSGEKEETWKIAEIDPEMAKHKRINKHNDLFKDRKPEFYGALTQMHSAERDNS